MGEIKGVIGQLVPLMTRIDAMLTSTLPHLATNAELAELRVDIEAKFGAQEARFGELRAELAEKPSKAYLWGVLAALIAAYAAGLGAFAVLK